MTIELHELVDLFGQAVDRHVGALFVGAGLSMQAGLPSWGTLVGPLAEAVDAETVTDMPLAAEYYEQNAPGGRSALEHHLLTELSRVTTPSPGHRLITELNVPEIWTTNFDPLLELADAKAGVINLDEETPSIGTGRRVIIKMHGGFSFTKGRAVWQSPPVTTRGDFERYEIEHPRMWAMLQASYMTR